MESSTSFFTSLELKVMSCNDLKAFNFFQKLSVYVVVSIAEEQAGNHGKQKGKRQIHKTPIDREGDGNPKWNHVMRFDFKGDDRLLPHDCDDVFIEFDLMCEAIVFGNKTIGEVRVPIKDLMEEEEAMPSNSNSNSNSNGPVRFVSYQVRGTDGKPNGVLHFSYKIVRNNKDEDGSGCWGNRIHCNDNNDNNKIEDNVGPPLLDCHPQGPYPSAAVEAHYPSGEGEGEVESSAFSGVHYPYVEFEPPPPLSLSPPHPPPPPPPPQEAYYSAPEYYYTAPPAAPPPGMHPSYYYNYYPPPPPPPFYPPPPPPPFIYNTPPLPYGYGLGSYGYGLHDHSGYPYS